MKMSIKSAVVAATGLFALTALSPIAALADSTQTNKNTWRNLGIGAGVVALHGLSRGNTLETVLGAAGAAYSANRYEQDRKHQAQQSRNRSWYHRSYTTYNHNNSGQNYRYDHRRYTEYHEHHDNGHHYGWSHNHEHGDHGDRDDR